MREKSRQNISIAKALPYVIKRGHVFYVHVRTFQLTLVKIPYFLHNESISDGKVIEELRCIEYRPAGCPQAPLSRGAVRP